MFMLWVFSVLFYIILIVYSGFKQAYSCENCAK